MQKFRTTHELNRPLCLQSQYRETDREMVVGISLPAISAISAMIMQPSALAREGRRWSRRKSGGRESQSYIQLARRHTRLCTWRAGNLPNAPRAYECHYAPFVCILMLLYAEGSWSQTWIIFHLLYILSIPIYSVVSLVIATTNDSDTRHTLLMKIYASCIFQI